MTKDKKVMDVTLEQQKLISSPLRVKIIYLLDERPMTAKQVADEIGKTTGSIHYHIQQLFHAGILEIAETKNNKGILEKYYRSKATHFRLKEGDSTAKHDYFTRRVTSLSLSEQELSNFIAEYEEILRKYLEMTVKEDDTHRTSYEIRLLFHHLSEEDE